MPLKSIKQAWFTDNYNSSYQNDAIFSHCTTAKSYTVDFQET